MPDSIIPISDAQAKAIEEALKTLQGFGGFLQETFGGKSRPVVATGGSGRFSRTAQPPHPATSLPR